MYSRQLINDLNKVMVLKKIIFLNMYFADDCYFTPQFSVSALFKSRKVYPSGTMGIPEFPVTIRIKIECKDGW